MTDELIEICDENNNRLGPQKMKSEAHREGLWHRTSHIWIYNSAKEILCQKSKKPSESWLKTVKTETARKRIRSVLREKRLIKLKG